MALIWSPPSRSGPEPALGPADAPRALEVGDPGARLLAGPPAAAGAEPLAAHRERLGPLPELAGAGTAIAALVRASGLTGRGGGGFPVATKLAAVARRSGWPVVVVNGTESEPASRKDATLLAHRPHLVLDGAVAAAQAVGAGEVVVALHRGASGIAEAVARAGAERLRGEAREPSVTIAQLPPRYVAGESSALASWLEGGAARPRPGRPTSSDGIGGRPTLIQNVETLAHLALIVRRGAAWFRTAGSPAAPGSSLITLVGAGLAGASVLELTGPITLRAILAIRVPEPPRPAAVLLGGYGGAWVDAGRALDLPLTRDGLAAHGLSFGCGLVALLGPAACGLAETARLLAFLAGEGAQQCGPCWFGLPALAADAARLAAGRAGRRDVDRMRRRATAIAGRGGCHHPDGAVTLIRHALDAFADDVERHVRRGPCPGAGRPPTLAVPPSAGTSPWR